MAENDTPAANIPPEPETPAKTEEIDEEMGDFIARHVLEKDAVFFEG